MTSKSFNLVVTNSHGFERGASGSMMNIQKGYPKNFSSLN